uniref:Uncharacterized protein n=1 Tax=Daphnia galeata TaxID=27404 RepID=A0A8J2RIE9_9CRUS|nr:unnamed protein product [Daphnia galeata]
MAIAPFYLILLWLNLSCASQVEDDVSVAHVYADIGSNVSLPCLPVSVSNTEVYTPSVGENSLLLWIREGKTLQHSKVEENGILTLTKITRADSGVYMCQAEESFGYSGERTFTRNVAQVELHVKSKFHPHSITWKLNSTGGYPIKSVSVIYQEVTDDDWNNPAWHRTYPEELKPSITQVEIYKLHPNTTYKFRVWAINKLGPGDYAEVMATTKDTLDNQVHGSLTSTYGRIQSSPWILTLAVLVGSVGFTVLVLAFFMLQNRRICSRRRTYDSSDDMELVTNIIVNPNYQAESDRTLLTSNEGHNDRQALLTCNFMVPRRPAVSL